MINLLLFVIMALSAIQVVIGVCILILMPRATSRIKRADLYTLTMKEAYRRGKVDEAK